MRLGQAQMQVAVRAKKLTPNRPAAVVTAQGPWVLTDAGLLDLAGDCAARRGIIRSGYAVGFHPAHSWPFRPRGSLFDAWHDVPVYACWSCPTSLAAPAIRRPTPPWAVACWRISRLLTLKIPMILVRGCGYFPPQRQRVLLARLALAVFVPRFDALAQHGPLRPAAHHGQRRRRYLRAAAAGAALVERFGCGGRCHWGVDPACGP